MQNIVDSRISSGAGRGQRVPVRAQRMLAGLLDRMKSVDAFLTGRVERLSCSFSGDRKACVPLVRITIWSKRMGDPVSSIIVEPGLTFEKYSVAEAKTAVELILDEIAAALGTKRAQA